MKFWIDETNEPVDVYSLHSANEICVSRFVTPPSPAGFDRVDLTTLWRPEFNFRGDRMDITGLVYDSKSRVYRMKGFSLATRPKQRKGRKA